MDMYPNRFKFHEEYMDKIMGTSKVRKALEKGMDIEGIVGSLSKELDSFSQRRKPYLLY